ncbi:hypothetical protein EBR37_03980, partial [bacterium]|nr:hypothetical protein [bacterium]
RVKLVGEQVQRQFRIGLLRMERNTKDRMSMSEIETVTPSQLINARPIVAAVREFFASSQLSQFMDQVNPLSELALKRRLSSMGPGGLSRERAGFEVRDAHATHYGRICAVETPEGANIGLVLNLANYAQVNDYGFIVTPYRKVINAATAKDLAGHIASVDYEDENGKVLVKSGSVITAGDVAKLSKVKNQITWPVKAKVTNEIVYLDASDEENVIIAGGGSKIDANGYFLSDRVSARTNLKAGEVDSDDVNYMDAAKNQIIGSSAGVIPFIEKNYVARCLIGSNQQRQAVPLISPMSPIEGGYHGYWNFESGWQSGKIFEGVDERRWLRTGGRLKRNRRGGILRVRERGYFVLVLRVMRRREIWIILVVERRSIVRSIMI